MCQVKSLNEVATVQYSKLPLGNNSTVQLPIVEVFKNFSDVIPNDGYYPFYERQYRLLGATRFMELVQKARAGSDTPAKLFAWMLKHNELVR